MSIQESRTVLKLRHTSPEFRTFAGEGSMESLSRELARMACERVTLVTSASMLRQGEALALVESALGERQVMRFGDAREHSPVDTVMSLARTLREAQSDGVVVLGGGSAIVTARAAVILSAESGSVEELSTRREAGRLVSPRLSAPKIPQWIVPSTPTTAYAKAGAAVRNLTSGERFALFDPKARAKGVCFDPVVAATAPVHLVQSSALNAFAMAVDGLQSGVDDPIAEAKMRHGLRLIGAMLRECDLTDNDVRVRLMTAALLIGQASDHLGTGLAQPISHALGPWATVGNGVVEALLLPATMKYNAGVTDAGLIAVAETLDPRSDCTPAAAIRAVEQVLYAAEVPASLREVGIQPEQLDDVADHVAADWSATRVPLTAGPVELRALLEAAW